MKKQAVFSDRVAAGVVRVGASVAHAVAGDGALPAVAPAADQARGVVVAARQQLRVVVPRTARRAGLSDQKAGKATSECTKPLENVRYTLNFTVDSKYVKNQN